MAKKTAIKGASRGKKLSGKSLDKVKTLRKAGGNQQEYLDVKMSPVLVSSY
jgi:hypothetical protein